MLRLNKFFYERGQVSQCFDIDIPSGNVAILGDSGAGKTSFLESILGFIPHKSGSIEFLHEDISFCTPDKRNMAYMGQGDNLFPHLTLRENLFFEGNVDNLAEEFGLLGCLDNYPNTLSIGQKARGGLLRVLLSEAQIALFDEPFAALSPKKRKSYLETIKNRQKFKQKLSIMVSHHPDEIRNWADFILFLTPNNHVFTKTDDFFSNIPMIAQKYV